MKQVRRQLRSRRIEVVDVPVPEIAPGTVAIQLTASLISSGTERSKAELASKTLVGKARSRPDAVQQVRESLRRTGLRETFATVSARLAASEPLGYSCAGVVTDVGAGVGRFRRGMRVAAAGAEHAVHAESVIVPSMMVLEIPDGVTDDDASFAALGSIAMHGIRQSDVELGGAIAVVGLGLVGQLTARIGVALGLEVIGYDPIDARSALAREHGASATSSEDDFRRLCLRDDVGVDATILCASTPDAGPITTAGAITRSRGTVVIVGDVGTAFPRALFYERELQVRLSRSYGPGRYDPEYEERGLDYPIDYVRWTERRNMRLFLDLVASGRVQTSDLVSRRFGIEEAAAAYELLRNDPTVLSIVVGYPRGSADAERVVSTITEERRPRRGDIGVAAVGAGNFATRVLFPALRDTPGVDMVDVQSRGGLSAADAVTRFGFRTAVSSVDDVLADDRVDAVVISTQHDSHADYAARVLQARRAAFVEKPLALSWDEFDRVISSVDGTDAILWVGFNRRMAPATEWLRTKLPKRAGRAPRTVIIRVNAGRLAPDHWLADPARGGGRLLGEGCHFVDLAIWLVGAYPTRVSAYGTDPLGNDGFTLSIAFDDGSTAAVTYATDGDGRGDKERVEVFGDGKTGVIEDWKRWSISANGHRERAGGPRQDKGHRRNVQAFIDAVRHGVRDPAVLQSFLTSSAATLSAADALRSGDPQDIPRVRVGS